MSVFPAVVELLANVPEEKRTGPLWDFFRAHDAALTRMLVDAFRNELDPCAEYQFTLTQGVRVECDPAIASGDIKADPSANAY